MGERQLKILKPAFVYFFWVFGTGFVLGTIRTIWMVPQFGVRTAVLMEMPLMLIAIFFAARWIVLRFAQLAALQWLAVGSLALVLLLTVEFTVVLRIQGLSIREYFAQRDPVAGTAYALSLMLFACAPMLVAQQMLAKTSRLNR
jgi:hypothetical protein